ncbi:Hypothetical predicted protein [Pelobates cultripes]|uniref:Endonuclease/exonuclease/phosphatase domain-containing protein n=1 Tax=Pelobates cultripes TaxID=61616 RepID=A0AAD1TIM6_PELCU|nr:Hypothetical predicted protein [Pelobates cultripes]
MADPQGRFLTLVALINEATYTIANVYAPNNNQRDFLTKVLSRIEGVQQGVLVLKGDFNCVHDPTLDSTSDKTPVRLKTLQKLAKQLNSLFDSYNLYDVWRAGTIEWSDHTPVILTLADKFAFKNKPPWCLNELLLQDPQFSLIMATEVDNYFAVNDTTDT